jgi:hypothetical protein
MKKIKTFKNFESIQSPDYTNFVNNIKDIFLESIDDCSIEINPLPDDVESGDVQLYYHINEFPLGRINPGYLEVNIWGDITDIIPCLQQFISQLDEWGYKSKHDGFNHHIEYWTTNWEPEPFIIKVFY